WANCHGSFPIGFIVLATFVAGRTVEVLLVKSQIPNPKTQTKSKSKIPNSKNAGLGFRILDFGLVWDFRFRVSDLFHDVAFRRLVLPLVLSLAAVAVLNPHGPRLFLYSAEMSGHPNIRYMEEWKQLPVRTTAGYLFLASVVLLVPLIRLSPRRFTP